MKKLQFTIFTIFVFVAVVFASPSVSSAQGLRPFGGKISDTYFCNCSYTWLITVDDSVGFGGDFIYVPFATTLYSWYQIFSAGPWVLGLYSPGYGVCLEYAGVTCTTYGSNQGTMTMVGTSLE